MPPATPLIGAAAITENLLKRRWSIVVLRHLDQGTSDPAEVIKLEPGLSPPVMNERLRTMVRYGLIARFPRPPPSTVIEYRLTQRGKKILDMLNRIEQLDAEEPTGSGSRPPVEPAPPPFTAVAPAPPSSDSDRTAKAKPTATRKRPAAKPPRRVAALLAMRTAATCLLALATLTTTLGAADSAPADTFGAVQNEAPTPAAILASQVAEIASSSSLSRKAKAQQIANAVRLAVAAATAGEKDPNAAMQLAKQLVSAAAEAAPQFTSAIVDAVATIPAIASQEGGMTEIRAAALAGAKAAGEERPGATFAPPPPTPPSGTPFGGNSGEAIVSPSH